MSHRLAASFALLAFAMCLLIGAFQAGNPFTTTVLRAMLAMAATYVIGLIVLSMGARALGTGSAVRENNAEDSSQKAESSDR